VELDTGDPARDPAAAARAMAASR